jgi:3-oxoadipate CoA-transferase beta subunit
MNSTTSLVENLDRGPLGKDEMAAMVARDIPHGSYVNLGIGQPTLVADHLPEGSGVVLHTENGMLNMGPAAKPGQVDPDLTNAGKIPMMRGGHLDICVLGAFQVSAAGDLANWHTGARDAIPAVGGAMDLAIGAKKVFVMMTLFAKDGSPKLVQECSYPLTGLGCVDRVYTDLATFRVGPEGATVLETFGITYADLAARLDVPLTPANGTRTLPPDA